MAIIKKMHIPRLTKKSGKIGLQESANRNSQDFHSRPTLIPVDFLTVSPKHCL